MFARSTASLVAFCFAVWTASPAMAKVSCRPNPVSCAHCPKMGKAPPSKVPALSADCCIIQAAVERPLATAHQHSLPPVELAEAPALFQPVLVQLRSMSTEGMDQGPAPPLLQRNQPLLR